MDCLFMVMKNMDKKQAKLIIRTNDYNVPSDHISRFVVDFIEDAYEKLDIKINENKSGRPSYNLCSMIKLLVWAKLEHMDSARIIADIAKYHDILNLFEMELHLQNEQYKDIWTNTENIMSLSIYIYTTF